MWLCPGVFLNNGSMMLLLVLAAVLAAARADCDACVEGRCYTRKTLARELYIPDQMAMDRKNGILYVHTDSEMNTAFLHEDLTIQLVRRLNFSGLAVDQDTQVLYTADNKNVYKYAQDRFKTSTIYDGYSPHQQQKSLLYKDCLTYTDKYTNGLYFILGDRLMQYTKSIPYMISDFIVQVGCVPAKIYFVGNDTTYFYESDGIHDSVEVVSTKTYVLSTDKYNNAYFGDTTVNVIYKMDNETNKLVEYAAYESGSVDKFVFDNNNNIVFYDSNDNSLGLWKPYSFDNADCTIEAPHSKYTIKKMPNIKQNSFIP